MWKLSNAALALMSALILAFCGAVVSGCERDKPPQPPAKKVSITPTLRIYALAGAAGAVEPCGCVEDMLGGIDHAAALIASQEKRAPQALVLGAGPMFFSDPKIEERQKDQALFKAEAMAASLKDMGLLAWAPGANDWALGVSQFSELSQSTGSRPLAANLKESAGPVQKTLLVEVGGIKVGLTGISVPKFQIGKVDFPIQDAVSALKAARKDLEKKGAEIYIALLAAQRGEALRTIEAVPGFQLAIIGKPYDQGDANDRPYSPEVLGGTLVVQATNHLQGISVIDLFVRDGKFSFADGSGLEQLSRRGSLERQAVEIRYRLDAASKKGGSLSAEDLSATKAKLKRIESQLAAIKAPALPKTGSYFLYDLAEVREEAGEHQEVTSRLVAYFRKVNEHNRVLFADKKPRPVEEGKASYLGVGACTVCHQEARDFWDKTEHAGAYETLTSGHREFNLDCVSCHVTGYEKPGGSTVVHVEKLTSVQCEVCHGPGSLHAVNPRDKNLIVTSPPRGFCGSACHHDPHVDESWSVDEAWPQILGKGHGL